MGHIHTRWLLHALVIAAGVLFCVAGCSSGGDGASAPETRIGDYGTVAEAIDVVVAWPYRASDAELEAASRWLSAQPSTVVTEVVRAAVANREWGDRALLVQVLLDHPSGEASSAVARLLEDDDPAMRVAVAGEASARGIDACTPVLLENLALSGDDTGLARDSLLRIDARRAAGRRQRIPVRITGIDPAEAAETFASYWELTVRAEAARALTTSTPYAEAIPALEVLLKSADAEGRVLGVVAVSRYGLGSARANLNRALADPDPHVAVEAGLRLAVLGDRSGEAALRSGAQSGDLYLAARAERGLRMLTAAR